MSAEVDRAVRSAVAYIRTASAGDVLRLIAYRRWADGSRMTAAQVAAFLPALELVACLRHPFPLADCEDHS